MVVTTSTPNMSKLGHVTDINPSAAKLKHLVLDALNKQLYTSAIHFAERLTRLPGVTIADSVLYARCFQQSGQHRRCLVALEYKGLLSVEIIETLSNILKARTPNNAINKSRTINFFTSVNHSQLSAILLAAHALFHLEEYDDCVALLDPLISIDEEISFIEVIKNIRNLLPNQINEINVMASLYTLVGRCYDILDNRPKAIRALQTALHVDPLCIEAADYIVSKGLLGTMNKLQFLKDISPLISLETEGTIPTGREWLQPYYDNLFADSPYPSDGERNVNPESNDGTVSCSAFELVHRANYMYKHNQTSEAYRLSRQAYTMDPFDWSGMLVYTASMVDLEMKNELFYLGHELIHSHPKHAIAWYTVGCYYYTCHNMEQAQRYLQKATKLDKRLCHAWIALGHVFAAQEESEHAISSYRNACRILPGDHFAYICLVKELVRTHNYAVAMHTLSEALDLSPSDPVILNELGVVYISINRADDALPILQKAAQYILMNNQSRIGNTGCLEILSNFGTCLRKCGYLKDAVVWFEQCLAIAPHDAQSHANIAFSLHLDGRFEDAIISYHRALSLQPSFSFCGDMLTLAMDDARKYGTTSYQENYAAGLKFEQDANQIPQMMETNDGNEDNENYHVKHNDASESFSHDGEKTISSFESAVFGQRAMGSLGSTSSPFESNMEWSPVDNVRNRSRSSQGGGEELVADDVNVSFLGHQGFPMHSRANLDDSYIGGDHGDFQDDTEADQRSFSASVNSFSRVAGRLSLDSTD